MALSVPYKVCYILCPLVTDEQIPCMQLLKTQSLFYRDLVALNAEMRTLVSDLMEIRDMIKTDSLKITVIEIMRVVVEASDYIRTFLAKRKIGE